MDTSNSSSENALRVATGKPISSQLIKTSARYAAPQPARQTPQPNTGKIKLIAVSALEATDPRAPTQQSRQSVPRQGISGTVACRHLMARQRRGATPPALSAQRRRGDRVARRLADVGRAWHCGLPAFVKLARSIRDHRAG